MSDILHQITEHKRLEIEHAKRRISLRDIRKMSFDTEAALSFLKFFNDHDINIIAEVKKASPSVGVICKDFDPVKIAKTYEQCGAKAVSVLTDEKFFQGHLENLVKIKKHVSIPALRKEFVIDEYQIFEGRAAGADAILLIAACLDDHQISDYHELICELGMTPLVEVHDALELQRALSLPLKLLGVNNRNLKTFVTDIETTIELSNSIPESVALISESGLKDHNTLMRLKTEASVNGFLIGESLLKDGQPEKKMKELLGK